MHATRSKISFLAALLCILFCSATSAPVRAQQTAGGFDHTSTGFPLIGGHASAACDACHTGGRFKGTPRSCAACHNGSQATGKSLTHPPTTNACEACHTIQGWDQTRYDHKQAPGPCIGCHNGSHAQGKPPGHVATTAPCETCHKNTVGFKGARFDHTGIAGNCASCHNGSTALGKSESPCG